MHSAEINIDDYLSEEERRAIAVDVWRGMCAAACDGNAERIISNIGYDVAARMVSEALGEDANELIKAQAIEVIGTLSEFTVFRRPDVWDREASPAYKTLMDAVKANSDLVEKKVRECIAQISKREALEVIKASTLTIKTGAQDAG
jgi:heterodisulfide reductase subunit B